MITPEKMEAYNQSKIIEMYEKLNQEITQEIIQKIKETGYVSGYTKAQMRAIIKTGGKQIFKKALKETNKLTADRKKEVEEAYNDVVKELLKGYEKQYERVGKEYQISQDMMNLITYMKNATNDTFKNMTKTVAFASKQEFVEAMDELYKKVVSGQKDYASALKEAVSKLADKGITLKSKGRNYSLESIARLNLMTGLKQTANDLAKKVGEVIDYNCVEIGHSYRCRPSHNVIDDVTMSKEEFKKYEYLTEEYNCYHIVNYTWKEEFEDPNHKAEYGEEHQTLEETTKNYKIHQKARYYERQIRAKKQAIANGDTSKEAKINLRNAQSKYKTYCNINGLKYDYVRTWQSGYNNANLKVSNSNNKMATKKVNKINNINEFINNNPVDIEKFNSDYLYKGYRIEFSNIQEEYAKHIGYSNPIKTISKKEYDSYQGTEISRILTGNNNVSSKNALLNNIAGPIQYSSKVRSYYGKGIYFGSKDIENKLVKDYGNVDFSVLNAKILNEANILVLDNFSHYIKEVKNITNHIKDDELAKFFYNCNENTNILFMSKGIDIIKIKKDNYYVVLNRGVLITYDE